MAQLFRWSVRLFTALATICGVAFVLTYYLASRSLPDYEADYQVPGLSGEVQIVRNNANLPHIFGQNDADVFFGLGFAHAQDRLWQMTLMRRTVQGKLSELFGPRTLKVDELMRRLDMHRAAQNSLDHLDVYTRTALAAYSNGVNAWLRTVNEQALGRGAPEFFLFAPEIAPWQPADSLALIKLMAVQLSSHAQAEVLRAQTALVISPDRLLDLLPDDPSGGVAALNYAAHFPQLDGRPQMARLEPRDPLHPVPPAELGGASNAFAAATDRAASGGALLANDPHLELSAPSIWYLARLELQGGGVIGGTIPGIPTILSGRGATIGWGLTSAGVDDQDFVIEQLNPDIPGEYLTPDGFVPFDTRRSIIEVADAAPVTIELQWSRHGPVLPGKHYGLASITPPGHVAALSWTALSHEDTSMQATIALMRAKSIDDAILAGRDFVAPAQNLTIAAPDGVAMKTVGHVPRRDPDHSSQGRIPSPGWLDRNLWQGILPYATNPEFRNPEGGIVGNTNNKTIDRPFPDHISFTFGDTQRVQRWQRVMLNRQVHTRDSFIEAQLDTVSPAARTLLPLIGADLWFTGEAAPAGTPERQRQRALALMADWNGEMSEHLPEPLIYAAWLRALQMRLIQDELGSLANAFTHVQPLFIERVYRNVGGASVWCDVIQSAPKETCTEISRAALDDAIIWMTETYGSNIESWRWGDAHEATHDHQVLGRIPVLNWFVNIRQSTSGGDHTLLRGKTRGKGSNPFRNVHGAGYRGVYDFADPDSSVFVIATGQSGHPLSRHYDDLGVLWRRGEYVPMSLDPDLARAGSVGTTRLIPRP